MSRNPKYQRMLNSPRWWQVKREVWLRANGLCEDCKQEGRVTPGVDCHHVRPVENAKTDQEMEMLCYNPANIRLLCIACHKEAHSELRSQTRDGHIATEASRTEQWLQRHLARPADAETKSPPTHLL